MTENTLYAPPQKDIEASQGWRFMRFVEEKTGQTLEGKTPSQSYKNLHQWSINNIGQFHSLTWDFAQLIGDQGDCPLENPTNILTSKFFPQGQISYAENMLKRSQTHPKDPAIIARTAGRDEDETLSWQDLYNKVSQWEQILERFGIGENDRISTYLPHIAEAYIIMIAAANLGAIFSSVGTEMGPQATADRFKQIRPKLLIAVDGYIHVTHKGAKEEERLSTIRSLQNEVDSLDHTIIIPNMSAAPTLSTLKNAHNAQTLLEQTPPKTLTFTRRPFNHPLAILFSSGSTGTPKCFVHGAGNLLLKHTIEHLFHNDVRPGDRQFYHTTTSWMMFNWLAGGLAVGSTLLIYDGNPAYPHANAQLKFAADYNAAQLGTAAGVIQDVWRANDVTGDNLDLSALRIISYTASVLSPEGYEYINAAIKKDLSINGICGGTDFVGCYANGNSFAPTCAGQLKGPVLGMGVETWDEHGQNTPTGETGELVITAPFVSRPLYFWNDETTEDFPHGKRFMEEYFTHYPDRKPPVWHHGDNVRLFDNGQLIIEGRSDSTLNQNGVRIGAQMLYDALDTPDLKAQITDMIAVSFKDAEGGDHTALFIVPTNGDKTLTPDLKDAIKATISEKVGRLCVPHEIEAAPYILKTPNGKRAEKPTKQALASEAINTPTTYGRDPQTNAFKAEYFEKRGRDLRQNPQYGYAAA
jgi:acetoacetyl-CoA synthetase